MPTTARTLVSSVALVVALLGAAACSPDEEDASDDVATLGVDDDKADTGDDAADDGADDDEGGGQGGRPVDPEFQDAMVEFAECMREHGIDVPDPEIDEND